MNTWDPASTETYQRFAQLGITDPEVLMILVDTFGWEPSEALDFVTDHLIHCASDVDGFRTQLVAYMGPQRMTSGSKAVTALVALYVLRAATFYIGTASVPVTQISEIA